MPAKDHTKNAIMGALIELVGDEPFEKITVTAICKKAGISRQAFYGHFLDKYDVAMQYLAHTIEGRFARPGIECGWREAFLHEFRQIEQNASLLEGLIQSEGYNSITQSTIRSSREDFLEGYRHIYGKDPDRLVSYQIERFAITSSLATDDWIRSGCKIPADEFVGMFLSLVPRELFEALDAPFGGSAAPE